MLLNKLKTFSVKKYLQIIDSNKSAKLKIFKGDNVVVISGDDKGKVGVVRLVNKKNHTLIVSDVNVYKKAVKQKDSNENFVFVEKPIHISNVKKTDNKN